MAERRVALAAVGAIVGAGFASGREIVSFFTAQGGWCFWGVAVCCVVLGLLVALLAGLARRTQSTSLAQMYARVMDERCGEAVQVAHTLLLLVVCAAMLSAAGEMGALAFEGKYARAFGVALAIAAALMGARSSRSLAWAGALAAAVLMAFYVRLCLHAEASGQWARGSAMASGAMGALYACLNAALAAGVICREGRHAASPAKAGLYTGALLFVLLTPACLAIGPLGRTQLALPAVALAGETGPAGFWLSLAALFAAAVSTLATSLYSLQEQLQQAGMPRVPGLMAAVLGPLLVSVAGFTPIVDVGYPMLSVVCAMLLPVLAVFRNETAGENGP